jgi:hypothetical protein
VNQAQTAEADGHAVDISIPGGSGNHANESLSWGSNKRALVKLQYII